MITTLDRKVSPLRLSVEANWAFHKNYLNKAPFAFGMRPHWYAYFRTAFVPQNKERAFSKKLLILCLRRQNGYYQVIVDLYSIYSNLTTTQQAYSNINA